MDVDISKAGAAETPASCVTDYVVELVTSLMTLGGIESINAKRYSSGFGSRLHVTIAPFPKAPKEVKAQGVVIKDAIATILSVANITRVVMKPGDDDMAAMEKMWDDSTRAANAANGGSGQDSLPENPGESKEA